MCPIGDVPWQRVQGRLVEDLADQAHVLVDQDLLAVADGDAGGLLAAVLQGVEAEIGELGDLLAGGPDAEDAAGVLRAPVVGIEVVGQQSVAARHGLQSRGWVCRAAVNRRRTRTRCRRHC